MRRILPLLMAAVLLAGCATSEIARQAGFEPRSKSIQERRQEPGHNLILDAATFEDQRGIDVGVGLVPNPLLSRRWLEELADSSRPYSFWAPKVGYRGDDGLDCNDDKTPERNKKCQEDRRILSRLVFRAVLYRDEVAVASYDAVINPRASRSFTLLPYGKGAELGIGLQQLVVASDGSFAITTQGAVVDLEGVTDLGRLPKGFFERFPSPIEFGRKSMDTDEGYGFIRMLDQQFPLPLSHAGKHYWGRPDAKVVWKKYTALDTVPDKLMTCVRYKMGPGMMLIGGIVASIQAGRAMAVNDCLK